jgi:serine/threonine protein kinase
MPIDLPNIKFSDFIVEEKIGEGGFSDVFKVSFRPQTKQSGVFALKCSKISDLATSPEAQEEEKESAIDDLMFEASILARLDHKNIIKAMGVSKLPAMLLLELLECTLEDHLNYWREDRLTLRRNRRNSIPCCWTQQGATSNLAEFRNQTESIVKGIANGLEYLHSKNIILRDLKPKNIGFHSRGEVKLFDFGFACEVKDLEECQNLAGTSLRYMPPEMLKVVAAQEKGSSDAQCGFAMDVYSFGVVLWEIATGESSRRWVCSRGVAVRPVSGLSPRGARNPGSPAKVQSCVGI